MSTLSAMGKAFLNGYGSTQNYSVLFNSLNNNSSKSFNMFDVSGKSSSSNLSTNFYSDYASLKNGSYGKLAKTWYAKQATDTSEKYQENPQSHQLGMYMTERSLLFSDLQYQWEQHVTWYYHILRNCPEKMKTMCLLPCVPSVLWKELQLMS